MSRRMWFILSGAVLLPVLLAGGAWHFSYAHSFDGRCARLRIGMDRPDVEAILKPFKYERAQDLFNPHRSICQVVYDKKNGVKLADLSEWSADSRCVLVGFNAQERVCWMAFDRPAASFWERIRSWVISRLGS